MKPVAAIILAAGASTRMGAPKQLARLGGEALLERAVRTAREADCVPLVVLGAHADAITGACELNEVAIVFNPRWEEGMATSIAAGVEQARKIADAVVLMTCDQPAVTQAHLRALIAAGEQAGCAVASSYAGRNGVPAYFPCTYFDRLLGLNGDAGARFLLRDAPSIPLARGELDIDTPEALMEAQQDFPGV